jgi:hypothetical protein
MSGGKNYHDSQYGSVKLNFAPLPANSGGKVVKKMKTAVLTEPYCHYSDNARSIALNSGLKPIKAY